MALGVMVVPTVGVASTGTLIPKYASATACTSSQGPPHAVGRPSGHVSSCLTSLRKYPFQLRIALNKAITANPEVTAARAKRLPTFGYTSSRVTHMGPLPNMCEKRGLIVTYRRAGQCSRARYRRSPADQTFRTFFTPAVSTRTTTTPARYGVLQSASIR